MARKKKNKKEIRKKLLHKYRLVILNEDTFEERLSFKLTRLNVFILSGLTIISLIFFTTVLIAYTPLREYIPGYSSSRLTKQATNLAFKTDSLQRAMQINDRYYASIKKVLTGDVQTVDFNKDSLIEAAKLDPQNIDLTPSREDSLLRSRVEREDKYNLFENAVSPSSFALYAPVKGTISEGYDAEKKHYAVDVVTVKDAPVKSITDGTVIFAGWTTDTGHVVIVDHGNRLISVYKHNSSLSKSQGETVQGGEVIAIVGSTGELTTGPHLHFELWSNGRPVNPTNYIDFD